MTIIARRASATAGKTQEPDAHGQAALLLAESLLHKLIETSVLSSDQALEVVQAACEVKVEVATAAGESTARMLASIALLQKMRISIESDTSFGHGAV